LAVFFALLLSAVLVFMIGYNPLIVFQQAWDGAFGTTSRIAGVFNFWIPLTLVSLGLLVTFRSGLWNIGVEGQIMAGAVFASGVTIFLSIPPIIRIPLAMLSAIIGGMLWSLLVGVLKTRFGVHEIFGGVAFNAISNIIANYIITNLWSPVGGNAQDIGLFDEAVCLKQFNATFPSNDLLIFFSL